MVQKTAKKVVLKDAEGNYIVPVIDPADKGGGYTPNLFDTKWSDHLQNDIRWLRGDTFSWQSGTVYEAAYAKLLEEYNATTSVSKTETVGSYTVTYKLTANGYKIAASGQEQNILNIYNSTGVAWYYILDTTNTQFKLPRTKYGFVGLRDTVGNAVDLTATGTGVKATQMYCYFYVGDFTQDAITNTAGLNSELFAQKLDKNLSNLDSVGQAILDKKVEVEALLEQNGYAKFTWKESNKVAILLQWGLSVFSNSGSGNTISYPITFPTQCFNLNVQPYVSANWYPSNNQQPAIRWISNTQFNAQCGYTENRWDGVYWFAIGY